MSVLNFAKICGYFILTLCNVSRKVFVGIFKWCFQPNKSIRDDVILITGGGRGLGRKLALSLARHRPKQIVLWGRQESCLQKTTEDIQSLGVSCGYQVCDVSQRQSIYKQAKSLQDRYGDVTMLINNAGVIFGKQLVDSEDSELVQALQVNTLSHIWATKSVLPSMIERRRGHIVCMCSVLGLMGLKGTVDYTTSKFAQTGLMESLHAELEEYPYIHTTIIHPYQVNNDMFHGCTIRFPRLFRLLDEEQVVELSVQAILQNRCQIVIPWYWYYVITFKSILPVTSLYPVLRFLGVDRLMDNFNKPSSKS